MIFIVSQRTLGHPITPYQGYDDNDDGDDDGNICRLPTDIGAAPSHLIRVIGRTMRMDDDDYVDNDIHLLIMKMIS